MHLRSIESVIFLYFYYILDALLATAATNGSVVTWNLNSSHKQGLLFKY